MGLLAQFSISDLGMPEATDILGLYVDYSDGCSAFAETFYSVATDLVPIDTGRLLGSISAQSTGDGCICEADCEYAQYVEYGTVYMGAQPYFEPAIAAALAAAAPLWKDAYDLACEEEADLLEEMEEQEERERASREAGGGRGGIFGSFGGFLGMLIGALIIGIVQGFLSLLSESMREGSYSLGSGRDSGGVFELMDNIDIEIT